jgi:hypothetical protein
MPIVLRIGPYRFFFYAGDRPEPPHIHVERERSEVDVPDAVIDVLDPTYSPAQVMETLL